MARNRSPQTHAKRMRELEKQAKREAKRVDRLSRAAQRRQVKADEADLPPEQRSGMIVVEMDRSEELEPGVTAKRKPRDATERREPRGPATPGDESKKPTPDRGGD